MKTDTAAGPSVPTSHTREATSSPPIISPQENGHWYTSSPNLYSSSSSPPADDAGPGVKVKGARALAPDLLRGLLMMIMALDHAAIVLGTWDHGTGRVSEADGAVVKQWNFATAYVVRSLTHLCAPGFTFLLGMGVVYLGQSRRQQMGWSATMLARYFASRCAVLVIAMLVFGFVVTAGQIWFMNMVLFSLAVDYLVAGLLWLVMTKSEAALSRQFMASKRFRHRFLSDGGGSVSDEEDVTQPLLRERETTRRDETTNASSSVWISWTLHNVVLVILGAVTILWNVWLSDDDGTCRRPAASSVTAQSSWNPMLRVWFWTMLEPGSHILSGFPPLAWLSFAILGILYARLVTARPWSQTSSTLAHTLAAICFSILFVLTRVLRFANLSEGCLQTPDQQQPPVDLRRNPYLASPASFFYVVKYPPDLAFFALTMAGNMLLLAVFTALPPRRLGKRLTMLLDFGTSALFFYFAHLLVLFGLGSLLVALFGHHVESKDPRKTRAIDSLWVYFGLWAVVMLLLWPMCRAYSRFKSGKPADSIWRFF